MKRLLTIILTVVLCIGAIPTVGFADTNKNINDGQRIDKKSSKSKSVNKDFKVDEYVEGEAIILLDNNANNISTFSKNSVQRMLPAGVSVERKLEFTKEDSQTKGVNKKASKDSEPEITIMTVSSDKYDTQKLVTELNKVKSIKYAEPNYKGQFYGTPNDTYYNNQWGLNGASGINIDKMWDKTTGSKNNVIAVLDTGVDITHPDISGNLWHNNNTAELPGKTGYNAADRNVDVSDDYGHGTHVAGILGAKGNNQKGVSGVNQNVSIMPLKVDDKFQDIEAAYVLNALEYINDAQSLGVNVIAANMSFGFVTSSKMNVFKEAINIIGKNGCVSVCAAGNEGIELDKEYYSYPASVDSPYVLSVGASSESGKKSSYTNYGDSVDIYAPGDAILSTVNADTYNPIIYGSNDKRSQYYEGFDSDQIPSTIKQADGTSGDWMTNGTKAKISIAKDYYEKNKNSLKWTINDAEAGDVFNIYLPYNSKKSATDLYGNITADIAKCPHFEDMWVYGASLVLTDVKLNKENGLPASYANGSVSNEVSFIGADDPMGYRQLMRGQMRSAFNTDDADKSRAIVLTYIVNAPGDHEIIIDNIGLSAPNVTSDEFEKYDFYSGTSMASPMIAGAIGLLKSQNSNLSAKQIVNKIKKMSNADKIFKMDDAQANIPYIDTLKTNKDKSITIMGKNFGSTQGKLTANNSSMNITKWSTSEIVISKNQYNSLVNKHVTFKITTAGGRTVEESFYLVNGKKTYSKHGDFANYSDGNFLTDGKKLYYVSGKGTVQQNTKGSQWTGAKYLDTSKVFPQVSSDKREKGTISFESDVVYMNGKFYGMAKLNSGTRNYYSLAAYNIKTGNWSRIADRPGVESKGSVDTEFKNIQTPMLAAYNGKLYLMGGIDMQDYKLKTAVRVFDPSTKKWSKGTPLPEGRILSSAEQVGNKLVMVLGSDGKNNDKVPASLIYDGKSWKTGASIQNPIGSNSYYVSTGKEDPSGVNLGDEEFYDYYREFKYYKGAVGLVKNGLMISGIPAEGLGDTYIYDISSNTYKTTNYQLDSKLTGEEVVGTVVDKTLYAAQIPQDEDDEDELSGWITIGGDWDDGLEIGKPLTLKKMAVSSGLYNVTTSSKNGKIAGAGKYLPGQKVTLKAVPKSKYFLKKFVVDGKKIKKNKTSIPTITKNIKASATFKKYATTVKLNKKKIDAKSGDTIKLTAKVKKSIKRIKSVTWKTSNKKYATVTKSGRVNIKASGKGKTVIITAIAKDGSKAKARCKIKIAK